MKTVGIIGGFGPETTAAFQLKIVELCGAKKLHERPPILTWNTSIPVRLEKDLILKGKNINTFLPFLLSAAKILEKAGADFLVLPCNTLHIFIDEIRHTVSIPVLSIVDEMALSLKNIGVNNIGFIGTKITTENAIHTNTLRFFGIETILPSKKDQNRIHKVILNILNKKEIVKTKRDLELIARTFSHHGTHHILLACTDLQLLFPKIEGLAVHDTMNVLAHAVVREIIGNSDIDVLK